MKANLFIPLVLSLFFTPGCVSTIANKSFSIHTGNSVQTLPKNDSCFTKHIDILRFTADSQQLYYHEIHICQTKNGKTRDEETRLAETLPYSKTGNMIITPSAVYDTLELRRGRLKTKYGVYLKRRRTKGKVLRIVS